MRYIDVDLSSDNHRQQPQIFGGYAGEHNETVLQVRLPLRMVDIECSGYRFDFQTSEDNKISSPLIPVSELNDGVLSFKLAEQFTVAGKLLFNIVAILSDENIVYLISKTNRVILYIEESPEGNVLPIDPNGYKDELQKMVDGRVSQITKGDKGDPGVSGVYIGSGDMPDDCNVQIDPNGSAFELPVVDQSYSPESENPQSGIAVAEALSGKADVEKWELLHEATTTEYVDVIEYVAEANKYKELYIELTHISKIEANAQLQRQIMDINDWMFHTYENVQANLKYLTKIHFYFSPSGKKKCKYISRGYEYNYSSAPLENNGVTPRVNYIGGCKIWGCGGFKAGATIKIWGLRK